MFIFMRMNKRGGEADAPISFTTMFILGLILFAIAVVSIMFLTNTSLGAFFGKAWQCIRFGC
jgi:hypothetical protein